MTSNEMRVTQFGYDEDNRGFDYTTGDIMSKTYFATDGSYGDAKDLIVLDTSSWDDETWDIVRQLVDSDRYTFAEEKHFELVNKDMVESIESGV